MHSIIDLAGDPTVQNHIRNVIVDGTIELDPFPYMFLEGVFPDALYDDMLANWPTEREFTKFVSGSERQTAACDALDPEHSAYWSSIFDTVIRGLIEKELVTKFWNALKFKFDDMYPAEWLAKIGQIEVVDQGQTGICLAQDSGVYDIGPHADQIQALVRVIIYLPEDDDRADLGTNLYGTKLPNLYTPYMTIFSERHRDALFERKFTTPYKRNTMLTFLNTPKSYHGFNSQAAGTFGDYKRRLIVSTVNLTRESARNIYGEELLSVNAYSTPGMWTDD